MGCVSVIAMNTFRESLRDKILYNLLFFALLLIGASVLLADLTIMEHRKIVTDMGLAALNLFGVIIAICQGKASGLWQGRGACYARAHAIRRNCVRGGACERAIGHQLGCHSCASAR